MSDQPDLSTLPQRMRYAARVLEETSEAWPERSGCQLIGNAREKSWTAQGIAQAAGRWESEDRSKAEIDEQVDLLAAQIYGYGRAEGLHSHRVTFEEFSGYLAILNTARRLIELGWRKGDPE